MVRVITPNGIVWNEVAQSVILPSTSGEMGILTGHVAVTASLDIGVTQIRSNGKWVPIYVMGGFAQVEGDEVTILVNEAERGDRIDTHVAQEALEAAEDQLNQAQNRQEKLKATASVKQARARLKAAQGAS
ncbi:MAG TPA: ATP synthase F1 subunit epsilon [Coleofasciculaceae cyanobacterium]